MTDKIWAVVDENGEVIDKHEKKFKLIANLSRQGINPENCELVELENT